MLYFKIATSFNSWNFYHILDFSLYLKYFSLTFFSQYWRTEIHNCKIINLNFVIKSCNYDQNV